MHRTANTDFWIQSAVYAAGFVFVLYQVFRGWQRGIMRQIVRLAALILCYVAAWFGGQQLLPALRSLGYPDMVLSIAGGCILGFVVYITTVLLGAILFKKTSQQSIGIVRFGYGAAGSALGLVIAMVFIWGALLMIRLVGTVAEGEVTASRLSEARRDPTVAIARPNIAVRGLAEVKHALEHCKAAPLLRQMDPVPTRAYGIISKVTAVLARPECANRLFSYPGAQTLVSNPKMVELREDPAIAKELKARDFLGLLKNKNVVNVANDPAMHLLLKKFELEKALDYCLKNSREDAPASGND